ncbi:MAG: hypothetical protein SAMD01599839_01350 [Rectinema sp.]
MNYGLRLRRLEEKVIGRPESLFMVVRKYGDRYETDGKGTTKAEIDALDSNSPSSLILILEEKENEHFTE